MAEGAVSAVAQRRAEGRAALRRAGRLLRPVAVAAPLRVAVLLRRAEWRVVVPRSEALRVEELRVVARAVQLAAAGCRPVAVLPQRAGWPVEAPAEAQAEARGEPAAVEVDRARPFVTP